MRIESMKSDDYVHLLGTKCPYCRSSAITMDPDKPNIQDTVMYIDVNCKTCKKGWQEVWVMDGWQPKE